MTIKTLKCPLNDDNQILGPITNTFYSKYKLTKDEIRLYEVLTQLHIPVIPKPTEDANDNTI